MKDFFIVDFMLVFCFLVMMVSQSFFDTNENCFFLTLNENF